MSKLSELIGRFAICSSLLMAGVVSSACATDMASDGDGAGPTPLASVTMANGDAITFYEIAPAVIDVAQLHAPRIAVEPHLGMMARHARVVAD
jgi:hypothetical protein